MESLACGTPVLATSVGGIPEIVKSPKVGTLVARKPEHVARALKTSLERTWSQSEILDYALAIPMVVRPLMRSRKFFPVCVASQKPSGEDHGA